MFDADRVWETVIAILLAGAGGLARLLSGKDESKKGWSAILSELFIAGFAGIMVLLLARTVGLSGDWLGLVCGMAGWMGPRILDSIAQKACKPIGLDHTEIKKEEK